MDDPIVSRFRETILDLGRHEKIEVVSQSDTRSINSLLRRIEGEDTIFVFKNEKTFSIVEQKVEEHNLPKVFLRDELILCPMENNMVPHHTIMSEDDITCKLQYHNSYQLPRILFSDPIVRWNGWKCGSYIEISRGDDKKYYRHLYCSKRCDHEGTTRRA